MYMSVKIAERLAHKRLIKDLSGNIIDWLDEENGGWIVKRRNIVNKERYDAHLKELEDLRIAGRAIAEQVTNPDAPDRNVAPSAVKNIQENSTKIEDLENKVAEMDNKLDAILKALQK